VVLKPASSAELVASVSAVLAEAARPTT